MRLGAWTLAAGTLLLSTLTAAADCVGGQFENAAGNCVCAKNNFLGETTIQDPNTLQPVRVPLCLPCPDDRVSLEGGKCSDRCPPGTGLFSFGTCIGCSTGLVAAGVDAVCAPCPAGQVNNPANTACTMCPENQYTKPTPNTVQDPSTGNQVPIFTCAACPPGTISSPGSSSLDQCREPIVICPNPGEVFQFGRCQACSADTYSNQEGTSCDSCPTGQTSFEGSTDISQCFNPFQCDIGFGISSLPLGQCAPCEPGLFSGGGLVYCQLCPDGLVPNFDQSDCERCPEGSVGVRPQGPPPYDVSTFCQACPPGTLARFNDVKCSAITCGPGTIAPGGTADCLICEANTYSISQTACAPCPSGSISPSLSDSIDACIPCPSEKMVLPGRNRCVGYLECPVDTYLDADDGGQGFCNNCPDGQRSPSGSISQTQCQTPENCDPGYFLSEDRLRGCTACDPGTFSAETRSDSCQTCPPGLWSELGSTSCRFKYCPAGQAPKFIDGVDDNPPDGLSVAPSGDCEQCRPGSWSIAGQPYCSGCGLGYVLTPNQDACIKCPANTYGPDMVTCFPCPDDRVSYPATGAVEDCYPRTICPPGTGKYILGGTDCFACDPELINPGNLMTCIACEQGTRPFNKRACLNCPSSTYGIPPAYNPITGETTFCADCPDGQTSREGSKDISACHPAPTANMGRRAALARVGACDRGLTACMLSVDTWDCVNTNTNLQSCGGCWSDGTGQDCTLLLKDDDMREISCIRGVCKVHN